MTRLRQLADLLDSLREIVRYIERIESDFWPWDVKNELVVILMDLQGALGEASTRLHMLAHKHADFGECQPEDSVSTGRQEGCDER